MQPEELPLVLPAGSQAWIRFVDSARVGCKWTAADEAARTALTGRVILPARPRLGAAAAGSYTQSFLALDCYKLVSVYRRAQRRSGQLRRTAERVRGSRLGLADGQTCPPRR